MSIEKRSLSKNFTVNTLIFILGFGCAAALIFWKCRYGLANIDECFYLTVPYRLCLGDALFVDEWHLSQMTGFILYPLVWVYMKMNGNLDGVVLAFRYICAAAQCAVGMFIYYRTRKYSQLGASVAAICYTLYIPFNISALSYNSMSLMAMTVSMVILLTAQKYLKLQYGIAGVIFAYAVLCCPYLLAGYVIYAVYVICAGYIKRHALSKEKSAACTASNMSGLIFFTAGAAFVAALFFAFVFSRTGFTDFLAAFTGIFSDPEHLQQNTSYNPLVFIGIIARQNDGAALPLYLALFVLLLLCLADKKRVKHRLVYFCVVWILAMGLMFVHWHINYINHLMWSVNAIGLFIPLLSQDETNRKIFRLLWLPGMIYACCQYLGSNQQFYVISSAATVSAVGSIIMLGRFARQSLHDINGRFLQRGIFAAIAFMMVFQISTEAWLRYKHVFWDSDIETQNLYVEDSIQKGLFVSEEKYDEYYNDLNNLSVLKNYDIDKILYLSRKTWYYLTNDYEFSTFSAWTSGVNEVTLQRLEMYYSNVPDKMPDVVYLELENEELAKRFCETFGYEINRHENAIVLTPALR